MLALGLDFPDCRWQLYYLMLNFVLLDSLGKRIRFIKQAVFELGLKNVTPVQSSVELSTI